MTPTDLETKWYQKGEEAGKTEGWMNLEETLKETLDGDVHQTQGTGGRRFYQEPRQVRPYR